MSETTNATTPRRGKATYYPGKIQKPVTVNLTDSGTKQLEDDETTHGRSRSDIFCRYLEQFGGQLTFPEKKPAEAT